KGVLLSLLQTALDVSNTDWGELQTILGECDQQLALIAQQCRDGASFLQCQPGSPPLVSMDNQVNSSSLFQASLPGPETLLHCKSLSLSLSLSLSP
ncbi:hypothetical protein LDENG_00272610, partial [Lucifuga dentata]